MRKRQRNELLNAQSGLTHERTGAFVQCPRGVVEVMRAIAGMIFFPAPQGAIEYVGQVLRFPLPRHSTRLAEREGQAVYMSHSPLDLKRLFMAEANVHGWEFVEQAGSAYFLASERYRLLVTTRQCNRYLILLSFAINRL